jgi:hypothetical protein
VKGLDIDAALALAKTLDGDIDGKSSTGTSTVMEGEERFVFGASYSGQQGVGISETSGVSANYVKGKKVSWLAGDQWSLHKDGSAFNEWDVDEMSSKTKAKGQFTSEINAKSVQSIIISELENFSFRQSETIISSINVGSTTSEIVVAAASTNAYVNLIKFTANVSAGLVSSVSLFGSVVDLKCIVGGKYEKTVTPFIVRAEDAALSVTTGTGLDIRSINSQLTNAMTRIEQIQTDLKDKVLDIENLQTSMISAGLMVEGGGSAVENWDVMLNEAAVKSVVRNSTITTSTTEIVNIKTSVAAIDNRVDSGVRVNI